MPGILVAPSLEFKRIPLSKRAKKVTVTSLKPSGRGLHVDFRIEKDSLGDVKVPKERYYGASTQRAFDNFQISELRFSKSFIRALALVKIACAETNLKLKRIEPRLAAAIVDAAKQIAQGKYGSDFVLDIYQTGSATSTNMNFNEVVANIANEKLGGKLGSKQPVHPNDHVNLGQSSNDIIPTAIHVAAVLSIRETLLPALSKLEKSLDKKAASFKKIIKIGRTHLQDATPITLGQEFSGYAAQVKNSRTRIESALEDLYELAVGGTAVGTGVNTPRDFGKHVASLLSKRLELPFREAENHFEAQAAKDGCVQMSGTLRTLAVSLTKVANDIRWLASGPRCGLSEITLPSLQPGSSIMPGKINPVMPESLLQVCARVVGNDATIAWAGASGNFELNVMMPVLCHCLLDSIEILGSAVRGFEEKCVRGIEADSRKLEIRVEQSLMLATALVPALGYDKAAALAKKAFVEGRTIREVATEDSGLSTKEINALLDPAKMI